MSVCCSGVEEYMTQRMVRVVLMVLWPHTDWYQTPNLQRLKRWCLDFNSFYIKIEKRGVYDLPFFMT